MDLCESSEKDNEVVGVISLMADIESVYQEVNSISRIFIVGTILSILITTVIGFVASKTVTSSIEKMSSQVKKMALGNYGTVVGIEQMMKSVILLKCLTRSLRESKKNRL